jgi:DNA-binding transcriptional ArsR family regulator
MLNIDPHINLPLTLKASSDPIRLQILRLLKRDSLTASELALVLDIKQSALSHHLKIMTQAAWLNTRREGNTLFYRRHINTDLTVAPVQQSILGCLDNDDLDEGAQTTLNAIRHARQQIGAAFFESHAEKLDSVTDRIAGYKHYSDAIQEALKRSPLSEQFEQVYALDIAQPMLDLAKTQVKDLNNIQFIHGDIKTALQENVRADLVALNMVLHHIASPAEFLAQCWQILNDNGQLLIADLCAHQQDWVREACGDFWMGFEPDELLGWARQLGFETQEPVLVGLKNGFQIQIHLLRKN